MASNTGAVWSIELGNDSLKALHLRVGASETVEVIGFDCIPYGKVLNAEGLKESEKDELIALALRNFLRQNAVGKDEIIISVPSQNSFARFVNLPPVEEKKIPQVVKLEAGMQIPFDINEVQWDWQLMSEPGASEARVGIFAVKNDVLNREIDYFSNEGLGVGMVQMTPMALYNYAVFDRPELLKSDKNAVMVINIGAENTDLVIFTKSTIWQRCMPIGGNSFTRAIADTFKLSFSKAEKLKKTAAMSKYARQVFQAMRPVFSDFVSELQRSLGFYNNSNPNTKLTSAIALGGGTKLRGLLKYIQQSIQVPVERPDSFKNLVLSPEVSPAKFHENVGDFGVVYGLALQGLGFSRIQTNLLPKTIAKQIMWAAKARFITWAAAGLLIVSALSIGRMVLDKMAYGAKRSVRSEIASVIETAEDLQRKLRTEQARASQSQAIITEAEKLLENRDLIPKIYETIFSVLPNAQNTPQQKELYEAFSKGDIEAVTRIPRKQRKQLFLTGISVFYSGDIEQAGFIAPRTQTQRGATAGRDLTIEEMTMLLRSPDSLGDMRPGAVTENKGFIVVITGYTPYANFANLLDPAGVGEDQSKWGVVTRLMNLDKIFEENIFELYKKTERQHFELEWKEVSADDRSLAGVGVRQQTPGVVRGREQYILVDPLTNEIISKVPDIDEAGRVKTDRRGNPLYQANDHWFTLKFKLAWKDHTSVQDNITEGPNW